MEAAAAPTPAAPAAVTATASPVPPPSSTGAAARSVHPAARWLARLFSPMSLKDQTACTDRFQRFLWGTLFVSFPIAYWLGNVLVTMGAVCAATVISLVVFVPNWYQHPDPLLTYADDTDVYHYYQQYEAAKKAAREPATSAVGSKESEQSGGRAPTPASRKKA